MKEAEFWVRLQGKSIKVFLKNNFVYAGMVTAVCGDWVEILDRKLGYKKIFRINEIADLEVTEI